MSDGPYRSLPMGRNWRQAARLAENQASADSDVFNALARALAREAISAGLPTSISEATKILANRSLFGEFNFDNLRSIVPGNPMANSFLNYLENSDQDNSIQNSVMKAVKAMLVERSDRAIRQIREHYLRRTNRVGAERVINRILSSLRGDGFNQLADRLIKNDLKNILSNRHGSGLDDGVVL